MRPIVYVVQDDPKKNFTPALDFGEVRMVLDAGSQVSFNVRPTVLKLIAGLMRYTEQDFLLAAGDPVAIGIACAIAASKTGGVFRMLKWDRQEGRYFPVLVNLLPERRI